MGLKTKITELLGIKYPIIGAPMFLVSNVDMVSAISEAGGIGTFPALNFRPIENYENALQEIRKRTKAPFGVNVIVNKSNSRQSADIDKAIEGGARLIITSLGSPREVIKKAHQSQVKVFCDVTNLEHAKKVQDMGADGVIAVGSGAGGHAGPLSLIVLIPWLKRELHIPVIAAGGIADGYSMAGALALGADGVSVGTRFIASCESQVDQKYKLAVINATPEDIVMTSKISGTPAAVINTDYIKKVGTDLNPLLKLLKDQKISKKYIVPLIHYLGMKSLEEAGRKVTWKEVWSAGQSVGLIHEELPCVEIIKKMVSEYHQALSQMPRQEDYNI